MKQILFDNKFDDGRTFKRRGKDGATSSMSNVQLRL